MTSTVTAPTPFANILHRDAIRSLVDGRTFDRGQEYFSAKRVVSLTRQDTTLVGAVRGTSEYKVRIWVKDSTLAYSCTCPMGNEGQFCKHGVAVGLAWLASEGMTARAPAPAVSPVELRARLSRLDKEALVSLLVERASGDPVLREALARLTAELQAT